MVAGFTIRVLWVPRGLESTKKKGVKKYFGKSEY